MHERQSIETRSAERVGKLQRRRACPSFTAIYDDEVGKDVGLEHPLAEAHELGACTQTEFDAHGLSVGENA